MNNNDNEFMKYFEEHDDEIFQRFLERNRTGSDAHTSVSAEPAKTESQSAVAVAEKPTRKKSFLKSGKTKTVATPKTRPDEEYYYGAYDGDEEIHSILSLVPDMTYFRQTRGFVPKLKALWAICTERENCKRLSCILIPAFLTLLLVLNLLVPAAEISEKENRTLAQFPEVSWSSITSGKFMNEFESYISDQFVFRNHYVASKRRYETLSGKEQNHGILRCDDGYLIENTSELTVSNIPSNIEAINSLSALSRYNVTVAIVPTAYEIYKDKLPLFAYTDSYASLQSKLKKGLKNAQQADVAPVLREQKDKYLYYRSDHHQTALGSYMTYTALAEQLGYKPYSLDDFAIEKMADDFCGTAWSNSGFASTENDIIYEYTLKNAPKCKVNFVMDKKTSNSLYSPEMLKTKDKYAYYLDGNHALTEITTDAEKEKKIAIIKDSYAHSIAPFLANHYSHIYMIDLRYYNGDIFEYLYKNSINDVLVLYNQNTFMTDTNLSKISEFAKNSTYTNVPDISYGIIPEQKPVDASYFDDAVFVGDSLTIGLQAFSGFNAEFMCLSGLNTRTISTANLPSGKPVVDTIKDMDHLGKLYIMLGTNEVAYKDMDSYLQRYGDFIDTVRETFPDVLIYIQSILPVSKNTSETTQIKIDLISKYNEELIKLAEEKQCYYIDTHSHFENKDGYLPDDMSSDGIHFNPPGYKELAEFFTTHAAPANSTVKIKTDKKQSFAGKAKADTKKMAAKIYDKIKFKDELTQVAESIIISNYKIDPSKVRAATLMLGGGATAEEIAVFEATSEAEAKKIETLAKERIERRKKDFENYIPAELTKLKSPVIVRNKNIVAVCVADKVSKDDIAKCIK